MTSVTIIEDDVRIWRLPVDLNTTDPEDTLNAGSFSIIQQPRFGRVVYRFNETFHNSTGTFPDYGELVYMYYPPEHYFTSENETILTLSSKLEISPILHPHVKSMVWDASQSSGNF